MKKFYLNLLLFSVLLGFSLSLNGQIIYSQPRSVTTCATKEDITIMFSVTIVKGVIVSSYKWQFKENSRQLTWSDFDPRLVPSSATRTLSMEFGRATVPLTTDFNGYQFRCIVVAGKTTEYSTTANLTVNGPPSIYSNPSGAVKNEGESVTFSVRASSALSVSYQWTFGGVNISGATSQDYSISNLKVSDAGYYRCKVTNSCGTSYSTNVLLTVNALPAFPDGWFEQVSNRSESVEQVSFVTPTTAWAVMYDSDLLLKTTNGGQTWSNVYTGYSGYWRSICFTDVNNGYAGGYNGITRTTDGGSVWTYTSLSAQIPVSKYFYIYDIDFPSASVGYAVGTSGTIIKTTDGGANWVVQNYDGVPFASINADLKSVHFVSTTTGYAVGNAGNLVKTTDGGATWTKLTTGVGDNFSDIHMIDANTGFVAGGYNSFFKITSGSTFTSVNSTIFPQLYVIYSVTFTDALNGFAAGYYYDGGQYYGGIARTNNGGANWYRQRVKGIETATYFKDIDMLDLNNGYAVGTIGNIWRTAKSGCLNPQVDLYEDLNFCASGSHLMVADTFSSNLNCSYLWTKNGTSAGTSGSLSVNQTGTYAVRVTNLCGTPVSDTLNVFVFNLPSVFAGDDVSMCAGDSVQLNGGGASSYSWSKPQYLNNSTIPNPLAAPPAGTSTSFTLTGTDMNGCVNTDVVVVTVNNIPTSTFTAPVYVCGSQTANFTHTGTSGINSYTWDIEGAQTTSGTTTGTPRASWSPENTGNKEVSLVVEKNNCYSTPTVKTLEVRAVPTSGFDAPEAICGDNSAELVYTGNAPAGASYNWGAPGGTITGSGQGPIMVSWATGGSKTVSLEVVQNQCSSGLSQENIMVSYPYSGEKICIVTIDLETGKNMVVWEKTQDVGIAYYNVYRLGTGGVYNLIGDVPADQISLFVDQTSQPEKTQYLYKITAVDTCGNESAKSNYHKTLFLQYTSSEGGVNLLWQDYSIENESFDFSDFNIYRGSDSTALVQIDVVSGSNVYTDTDPEAKSQKMYYRVAGVLPQACDPAGLLGKKAGSGPFVHSLSNLEDNKLKTGIVDGLAGSFNIQMFPNPFTEQTRLSYRLAANTQVKIEIYNIVGEKLAVLANENQTAGNHFIDIGSSDLNGTQGLYYVRIQFDGKFVTRKLILK